MKRDMELIRSILFFYEEASVEWVDTKYEKLRKRDGRLVKGMLPDIDGYSDEQIRHGLSIMADKGLLVEHTEHLGASSGMPTVVLARRLGWNGHEFLAALRDEEVFARVTRAADNAKNWTLQFVLEAAKRFAFEQLGI